jgi:hypothetical protein
MALCQAIEISSFMAAANAQARLIPDGKDSIAGQGSVLDFALLWTVEEATCHWWPSSSAQSSEQKGSGVFSLSQSALSSVEIIARSE